MRMGKRINREPNKDSHCSSSSRRDQSHDDAEAVQATVVDQKPPSEEKRNGTTEDVEEKCDKTNEPEATATDVLSSNAVTQQHENNKNGKSNNKKNKKNAKGKLDSPTSEEIGDVKA